MEKHIGYYMECHLAVLFEKDVDDAFDWKWFSRLAEYGRFILDYPASSLAKPSWICADRILCNFQMADSEVFFYPELHITYKEVIIVIVLLSNVPTTLYSNRCMSFT